MTSWDLPLGDSGNSLPRPALNGIGAGCALIGGVAVRHPLRRAACHLDVGIEDLIAMKRMAAADPARRGRSKALRDQADIELLLGDLPDPDEGW